MESVTRGRSPRRTALASLVRTTKPACLFPPSPQPPSASPTTPRRAFRPELRVRPARLSRRAGRDRPACHERRQLPGADADRRRQVAVLSIAGLVARGLRHRRLAADRADARPGRGTARGRRQGGGAEFDAVLRRGLRGRGAAARRRSRPALRRARAAVDAALPQPARPRQDRPVRDRRGALRVAMGARLPPGIYRPVGDRRSAFPTCRASR